MARYRVQGPDGAVHVFDGPDGATPDQVSQAAGQFFATAPSAAAKATADWQKSVHDELDPGVMGSTVIGAGRTTDRVLKGLEQAYLEAKSHFESPTLSSLVTGKTESQQALADLKHRAEADDESYKPLQDQHPVASAVGEALPAMVIPAGGGATLAATAGRLAVAGALPGALEYGSAGERAMRAAGGAAAGVAGGVIVPKLIQAGAQAVPAIGRTARAIVEPLTANGRSNIVGRTLNRAAGEDAAGAATRMAGAQPLIPGSLPTAGQVAENGGIAALERSTAAAQPADFAARGMEQAGARQGALRSIAQDAPAQAAAVAARKTATDPLYEQAKAALYTLDPRLEKLLGQPNMQKALAKAEELAANNGRQFSFDVAGPSAFTGIGVKQAKSTQVTGQGLQDLKMAVDAMLTDPTSGFAGKAGDALKAQRGQLLNWMEGANPAFKAARETFRDMSAPINQMQIGSDLMDKLAPALSDYGALGKETAAKYALALRNAPATAKNATKFPGASLEDIMTPEQMSLLNNVARDLARKSNAQDLGRGVGSDTFQKGAMANIAERSGAPGLVGGMLNLPGVNKLAKFAYSGPDEQIETEIARSLLDPQTAAKLMGRPGAALQPVIPGRQILLGNPPRATQLGGGATAQAVARLFAQ